MAVCISNRFPAQLGEKRLKISRISKETGLSRTTLTRMYYGQCTSLSFHTLDVLCKYLNCGIEDIIELSKEA